MNTINCRIVQNEYQDIPGENVTPAEAVIIRHIHDKGAANESKTAAPEQKGAFWKVLRHVTACTVAQQMVLKTKTDPKTKEQIDVETYRPRTDAEELQRLRAKYNVRAKGGAPGTHILDDLFPGDSPKLPETVEEIGLDVPAPAEKKAAKSETETA